MFSYGDRFYEGRKEGRKEATLVLARSLIGVLSVEVIAEKTGLSREIIEQLSRE